MYHKNNHNYQDNSFDENSPAYSSELLLPALPNMRPTTYGCPYIELHERTTEYQTTKHSLRFFCLSGLQHFSHTSSVTFILSILLFYAYTLVSLTEADKLPSDRYHDKSFLPTSLIYNRKVSCGNMTPGVYTSRTWTCSNIRVDGRKIAFGHYPVKSPHVKNHCFDTNGTDDIGGICLGLMKHVNESAKLWAASVTNATCDYTEEERVLLTFNASDSENHKYIWKDLPGGSGWIETLHCLTLN
ncbi:uncharacterized protein LOC106881444 [Octopus bimaculoides]|uniref:uncharacterized protein LOC106881444 n=1 Tax=Octopus bimaculoides TaxID=37653 RepID=UPI00071D2C15|nr:uncharacterized protein LOC106881444 [Octopus bimaculoides]|eukprot:XP_014787318.1 PREDICTED: uncharacterized protein LOC106881444 [Octopus bimaculoides]